MASGVTVTRGDLTPLEAEALTTLVEFRLDEVARKQAEDSRRERLRVIREQRAKEMQHGR